MESTMKPTKRHEMRKKDAGKMARGRTPHRGRRDREPVLRRIRGEEEGLFRFTLFFALFLVSWAAAPVAGGMEFKNLVRNPGFERVGADGLPSGWRANRAVWQADRSVAHAGQVSFRYTNADAERYELASQDVPLKRGVVYEFSVWVKTKGIQGDDSGATICIEFWGKDGEYIGGSYPRGVKGDHDWTLVRGVAQPVPEGTARCNVTVYVRKGMTGTAWFDDVVVRRAKLDLLDVVLCRPNYRGWIGPDGPKEAELDVLLRTDQEGMRPQDTRLILSLAEAGGKTLKEKTLTPRAKSFRTTLPFPETLAVGNYLLTCELKEAKSGETLATSRFTLKKQPPTFQPFSRIDEHNRLIRDGKPFFPLGLYANTGLLDDKHLKLIADSPFNCLMPYGVPKKEELDRAEKYGVKIIASIKDLYAGTKYCPKWLEKEEDEKPTIEKIVKEFRHHPALLAWYLNDELPLLMIKRLVAHQQWVEELDPDHPTWVVLFQVGSVRRYIRSFDVIGTDPYPIPGHPSRAAQWTRETVENVCASRPVWMVPQIFNWDNYRKDGTGRTPTFEEMRSMSWQCICEGAQGLIYYSLFDIMRDKTTPFDVQWDRVKKIAAEIKQWIPVLVSVDKPRAVGVKGEHLHATARARDGRTYLFVVNDDYEAHEGRIVSKETLKLKRLSDGKVLDASAPLTIQGLAVEIFTVTP
jgi:hypothetical protein